MLKKIRIKSQGIWKFRRFNWFQEGLFLWSFAKVEQTLKWRLDSEYQKNKFAFPGLIIVFKHPSGIRLSGVGSKGGEYEGSELNVSLWLFLITKLWKGFKKQKLRNCFELENFWFCWEIASNKRRGLRSDIEIKSLQSSKKYLRNRLGCLLFRPCKSSL